MSKRMVFFLVSALSVVSVHPSEAQVARIGFVLATQPTPDSPMVFGFRQELRKFGWVEGENLIIEYGFARAARDRYAGLTTELVALQVDVIVASGFEAVNVARKITKTIPIVMLGISDPVAVGFVVSLARPGGNVTGVATLSRNVAGKQLQLLKSVTKVSHAALLHDAQSRQVKLVFERAESAAKELGIKLETVPVQTREHLAEAFEAIIHSGATGALLISSPLLNSQGRQIAELAVRSRLPIVYPDRRYTDRGGLISYGPNIVERFRQAAWYVDKILRGANPAELPVEQAMELELVINLRAANRIGLSIPPEVLMWADDVIQ